MKVVSFKYLSKKRKQKKHFIYCTKSIFKPLVYGMGAFILLFVTNLLVNNFFANVTASLENFVNSVFKIIV